MNKNSTSTRKRRAFTCITLIAVIISLNSPAGILAGLLLFPFFSSVLFYNSNSSLPERAIVAVSDPAYAISITTAKLSTLK